MASAAEEPWVPLEQYRGIQAGLRVVGSWVGAHHQPEAALDAALRREPDRAQVVLGLATVARLLAIELAAATGSTEPAVMQRLAARVDRLQHPSPPGA